MKLGIIFILVLIYIFNDVYTKKVRYDNWDILEIDVNSEKCANILRNLIHSKVGHSLLFFEYYVAVGTPFHVGAPPKMLKILKQMFKKEKIQYRTKKRNIQKQINLEAKKNKIMFRRSGAKFDWKRYYTLEEINTWLQSLPKQYSHVQFIKGGKTYEGRDINGVVISKNPNNPGIYIEGGMHAREWISPATVTFILNQLLTSTDQKIQDLANNYNWYIFPVTNPDGYKYTHTTNRFWRKNRSMNNSNCDDASDNGPGVDLNRNWNCFWEGSNDPCHGTYPGPSALSEVETRTLAEFLKGIRNKIYTYLTFHSFGQLLLVPYSGTNESPHNIDDLLQIADATVTALHKRYGTGYGYGEIIKTLYKASGSTSDYMYRKLKIDLPFAFELRGTLLDLYGFQLPAEQIIPTGLEIMDSVVELIRVSKQLGYFNKTKDSVFDENVC